MIYISLLLDEDIQIALATALRKRGVDALHVQELERKGMTDFEQLIFAAHEQRCFVTYNVKDFVILHNNFVNAGREHWGIFVSKQLAIGELLRRLLQVIQSNPVTKKNSETR